MKKFFLIIFTFVFFFHFCVFANTKETWNFDTENEIVKRLDIEPVYIDLRECLLIAALNSSTIKEAEAMYKSKDYEYKYALSDFLPQIGLQGYISRIEGQVLVGGALPRDLNEWPLYGGAYIRHDLTQGGKTIFEAFLRKNLKRAEGFKAKGTKQEILYYAAVRYYELIQAKLVIQDLLTALGERKYQYEIANARYEVGAGDKFDVIRTDIQVKQNEIDLTEAIIDFRIKQAKLSNTIGIEVLSPVMPIEKDVKAYRLLGNLTIEEIYENSLKISPEIKRLKAEIASLRNQRNQNFSDVIPKANIEAAYSYQGTIRYGILPNTTVTLNIDIPIGDNIMVGTLAKIKAMDKQIEAKQHELRRTKSAIKENIFTSYTNSYKALAKIELYKKETKLTEQSTTIATGKFFEGYGELLDVIQAQTEKTQIDIALSKTKIQYNISQLDLLFYGGLITIENILNDYSP